MQEVFVGADAAWGWLDVHRPDHGVRRIDNTPAVTRAFARTCARDGVWVVFEASGCYDRTPSETLIFDDRWHLRD